MKTLHIHPSYMSKWPIESTYYLLFCSWRKSQLSFPTNYEFCSECGYVCEIERITFHSLGQENKSTGSDCSALRSFIGLIVIWSQMEKMWSFKVHFMANHMSQFTFNSVSSLWFRCLTLTDKLMVNAMVHLAKLRCTMHRVK